MSAIDELSRKFEWNVEKTMITREEWQSVVDEAEGYTDESASMLEKMHAMIAERDKLQSIVSAEFPEGCTPADARVLREANHALAAESFSFQQECDQLRAMVAELERILKLALEYWTHRQQRYKNRSPVWVVAAKEAMKEQDNAG